MFFRRKVKSDQTPILGDDGFYYIEDGVDYNSEEYETDSDDDTGEEQPVTVLEEEKEILEGQPRIELETPYEVKLEDPDVQREVKRQDPHIIEEKGKSLVHTDLKNSKSNCKSEDEEKNVDQDSITIEDMKTTLLEKRSLVYLASQHDRVDILKAILQPPNHNQDDIFHLILNNHVPKVKGDQSHSSFDYRNHTAQDIFLPPLHVAISSLSVNAATCLLRMGADPSIRPAIPQDWKGPEGCIDENGSPSFENVDLKTLYDGKSAWELAFPKVEQLDPSPSSSSSGWFSLWAPYPSKDRNNGHLKESSGLSNMDGIKHAFTAEILRALGSDEVNRLKEILNSGIDPDFSIAGKGILTWSNELGATNCSHYLLSIIDNREKFSDENITTTQGQAISSGSSVSVPFSVEGEMVFDKDTLQAFLCRIEESESLNHALSVMRDNLAEELSITEGLLMQHDGKSNDALISHVRMLKQKRAELDDYILEWEDRIQDISQELDISMMEWKRIGGSIENELENFNQSFSFSKSHLGNLSPEEMESRIKNASKHLNQIQKKVKLFRENIAELAVQTSRNLEKVEELGLQGAVNLARKIKEETREQETVLRAAKLRANDLTQQLEHFRQCIDRKNNVRSEVPIQAADAVGDMVENNIVNSNHVNDSTNSMKDAAGLKFREDPNENLRRIDMTSSDKDDVSSLEEEIVQHNASLLEEDSSDDKESSEESFEVVPGRISNTNAIRQGLSTDLSSYGASEHFFHTRVWDLIKRIIGLGKAAAKSAVDDVVNLPRVMII